MSRLTDEELLEIQVFIDRARDELHSRGLTIEVDTDLSKWVHHMPSCRDLIMCTVNLRSHSR